MRKREREKAGEGKHVRLNKKYFVLTVSYSELLGMAAHWS